MPRTSVATDNFNRASLGTSDWTQLNTSASGDVQIDTSTRIKGQYGTQPGGNRAAARWVGAGTFADDQYASIRLATNPAAGDSPTNSCGVIVRASSGTGASRNYYEAYVVQSASASVTTVLAKWVSGTQTVIATGTSTWATNDLLSLEAEGTTLRVCRNGTPLGGIYTVTDSSLSTGAPGVTMSSFGVLGDDFEGGSIAADTTGPTLTSPTGTATGATTASGTVSTNEAGGTLYRLASTNATELAATVKAAGLTSSVTAAGTQTVSFTGLTPSTTYYPHYVHTDPAGNDSARVSGESFTTSASSDTTEPTQAGAITVGTATSTSIQFSWPAGADNVGVVGYDVSSNGGSTWTSLGNVLTHTFSGLTPSTAYALRVRPRDAAGNVDGTPLAVSQTTPAAGGTYSLSLGPFALNTGSGPLLSAAVSYTLWPGVDTGAVSGAPINGSGTTHATTGALVITGLAAAGSYLVAIKNADGSGRWHNVATAA